jgi:hypothetical protein
LGVFHADELKPPLIWNDAERIARRRRLLRARGAAERKQRDQGRCIRGRLRHEFLGRIGEAAFSGTIVEALRVRACDRRGARVLEAFALGLRNATLSTCAVTASTNRVTINVNKKVESRSADVRHHRRELQV